MASHERLAAPPTGPHAAEDLGHATHPAMWTGCIIAFVSSVAGTIAALGGGVIFWVLCVVLAIAALVTYSVMTRMGMGQYSGKSIDTAEDSPSIGIS